MRPVYKLIICFVVWETILGLLLFVLNRALLQHRLISDYLLAEEGGVCGKLNLSTCCLKIDDNGRIVKEITKYTRKVTHVPVQTWNSLFLIRPGGLGLKGAGERDYCGLAS